VCVCVRERERERERSFVDNQEVTEEECARTRARATERDSSDIPL